MIPDEEIRSVVKPLAHDVLRQGRHCMSKIRINELARELEVKPNVILDLLPELGVPDKKTHSSSLDDDVALEVRRRVAGGERRRGGTGAGPAAAEARTPAVSAPSNARLAAPLARSPRAARCESRTAGRGGITARSRRSRHASRDRRRSVR